MLVSEAGNKSGDDNESIKRTPSRPGADVARNLGADI
jgi:hypothetical protein